MKKNLFSILLATSTLLIFNSQSKAQSTLIYDWNFNIVDTTVTNPHNPSYTAPGAGSATIIYDYGTTGYIDFTNPGTALNAQMGDDSAWSLRLRVPADSMVIKMPTTHYANIHFSYATERSGSGPSPVYVYYTTNGTTFVPACAADPIDSCVYTTQATWTLQSYNFSGDAATKNNPNFAVRISYGNWTGGGNNRFDNMILKGDTLNPTLGVYNLINNGPQYTLYPNPATSTITVNGLNSGSKSIFVTNILGQKVYATVENNNEFSLDVAALSNGVYFINIRENEGGNSNSIKFIKQ